MTASNVSSLVIMNSWHHAYIDTMVAEGASPLTAQKWLDERISTGIDYTDDAAEMAMGDLG